VPSYPGTPIQGVAARNSMLSGGITKPEMGVRATPSTLEPGSWRPGVRPIWEVVHLTRLVASLVGPDLEVVAACASAARKLGLVERLVVGVDLVAVDRSA